MLASYELGLGSVWLGIYPSEQRMHDLSIYLDLPEHVILVSLIAVDLPAEIKEIPDRFEPVKIHYNGW